jgi:DNA-directed RNA polymerase subunit RPC12/RpoP
MHLEPMPAKCLDCGHEWMQETVQDCHVDVLIALLQTIKCPKCRAGSRRLVFTDDAKARVR